MFLSFSFAIGRIQQTFSPVTLFDCFRYQLLLSFQIQDTGNGGKLVTREERFKERYVSDIPGPGTYQLSPLIKHSVLKSTFNATLNNPVTYVLHDIPEMKSAMMTSLAVTA